MKNLKETLEKIQELEIVVKNAQTFNVGGRQTVANACQELYNLIEEDVYNVGAVWMLQCLYKDLCKGNFAEPFMCEQKKTTFLTCKKIYEDMIVPKL